MGRKKKEPIQVIEQGPVELVVEDLIDIYKNTDLEEYIQEGIDFEQEHHEPVPDHIKKGKKESFKGKKLNK